MKDNCLAVKLTFIPMVTPPSLVPAGQGMRLTGGVEVFWWWHEMNFLYPQAPKPPETNEFWGCSWYCPKHREKVSNDITDDTEGSNTAHLCVHLTAPILPEAHFLPLNQ